VQEAFDDGVNERLGLVFASCLDRSAGVSLTNHPSGKRCELPEQVGLLVGSEPQSLTELLQLLL
jgi:hypothetical protein